MHAEQQREAGLDGLDGLGRRAELLAGWRCRGGGRARARSCSGRTARGPARRSAFRRRTATMLGDSRSMARTSELSRAPTSSSRTPQATSTTKNTPSAASGRRTPRTLGELVDERAQHIGQDAGDDEGWQHAARHPQQPDEGDEHQPLRHAGAEDHSESTPTSCTVLRRMTAGRTDARQVTRPRRPRRRRAARLPGAAAQGLGHHRRRLRGARGDDGRCAACRRPDPGRLRRRASASSASPLPSSASSTTSSSCGRS